MDSYLADAIRKDTRQGFPLNSISKPDAVRRTHGKGTSK
jgi:hypothetical protein